MSATRDAKRAKITVAFTTYYEEPDQSCDLDDCIRKICNLDKDAILSKDAVKAKLHKYVAKLEAGKYFASDKTRNDLAAKFTHATYYPPTEHITSNEEIVLKTIARLAKESFLLTKGVSLRVGLQDVDKFFEDNFQPEASESTLVASESIISEVASVETD